MSASDGVERTIVRPTREQLTQIADDLGLGIRAEELHEYAALVDEALESHDWLAVAESAERATQTRPERAAWRPEAAENQLGAWYWRSEITGASSGPLRGRTVVFKDNICVAGIPMMNGSAVLEGYIPDLDATVVTRVLAAGGTIVGKAVCESLCYSGGSHTSDTGPVRNPRDTGRSSGGSSSGCGALVAAGEVDLAIGGDQGGSIRGPSSWSGCVGLKPTYGLVPYTGAFPLEMTLDHLGPMARTVADVALLLDVIAGPDGLDPRQGACTPREVHARESLDLGVGGLRLGLLAEGFNVPGVSEVDVDSAVWSAASAFSELGASVTEVSIPWHRDAGKVTLGIAAEGSTALLIHGQGVGNNWRGLYVTSMLDAFARGRRERGDRLPPMVKLQALVGQWMHEQHHGRYYALAQNLAARVSRAYDAALAGVDLLVLPTTPLKATPLPPCRISATESTRIAHQMGMNTSPFNVTGHPAVSVPCALSGNLPVGMMLVGRRGEDALVLRAAHAFETMVYRLPEVA